MKQFHGWDDKIGVTFGMEIDATGKPYRELKKRIEATTRGEVDPKCSEWVKSWTVYKAPAVWVGAVMGEAHWLVTEKHCLQTFWIEDGIGSEAAPIWIDYSGLKENSNENTR